MFVGRLLTYGMSVFSNMRLTAVGNPVRSTDREDVHMTAGQ
jgi:hypothetical protein